MEKLTFENITEHPSFDQQFENVEKIPFQGSEIEVWDLKPENEKEDTPPVLFIPGWAASPRPYKDGLQVHFDAGRRVISLSFSPTAEEIESEDVSSALNTKAEAIREVLRVKNLEEVDVIGYSEGNLTAILATAGINNKFRHFVLEAPPGLTGAESTGQILGRVLKTALQNMRNAKNLTPENKERMALKKQDIKKWMKGTGVVKGFRDAMQPGYTEVDDLVQTLRDTEEGEKSHGISIIAAVDDTMVGMERFQTKNAEDLGIDGFYSVKGSHDKFEIETPTYARAAEAALVALENKYNVKTEETTTN